MYVFVQVLSCFQKGERSGNQIKEKVWKLSYNLLRLAYKVCVEEGVSPVKVLC